MTITDLLADLEAKATQAKSYRDGDPPSNIHAYAAFKEACSPDRILALVRYVRKLEAFVGWYAWKGGDDTEKIGRARKLLTGHLDAPGGPGTKD